MVQFQLKKDDYRRVRDGYARFFNIYCDHCGKFLLLYQKDGHLLKLKRLYLDRILAPKSVSDLSKLDINKVPDLVCKKCQRLIAIPGMYEKENRKVYLLLSYAFVKKLSDGSYPPQISSLNRK